MLPLLFEIFSVHKLIREQAECHTDFNDINTPEVLKYFDYFENDFPNPVNKNLIF